LSCLPHHPTGTANRGANQLLHKRANQKKNGRNAHHSPILAEDDTFE
jgi:hypothetical protein